MTAPPSIAFMGVLGNPHHSDGPISKGSAIFGGCLFALCILMLIAMAVMVWRG